MVATAALAPRIPLVTLSTPLGDLDLGGWNLLWAALLIIGTLLVAKYASGAVLRYGHRVRGVPDDTVLGAARVLRYLIYLAGVGLVLSDLGAAIRPLLVAFLVLAGVAVLLGRGIADNFGAGLLIQTRRTVKLGDLIESGGHRGHVTDLNSRSVVIATLDGVTIHLPNKQLLDAPILNLSSRPAIRSELEVRIDLSAGGPAVGPLLERVVDAVALTRGVRSSPMPDALVVELAPQRLTLRVRVWHEADVQAQVCSRATVALAERLGAGGLVCAVRWPPAEPPLTTPTSP